MKMTTGSGCYAISCGLCAASDFRFYTQVSCQLERDTAAYAACRFLSKNKTLGRALVLDSYRMRTAEKRSGRRPVQRCLTVPAPLLDLPGSWAQICLRIAPEGVTVTGVSLLEAYPAARKKRGKTSCSDG